MKPRTRQASVSSISLCNGTKDLSGITGMGNKIYMQVEIETNSAIKDRLRRSLFDTNFNHTSLAIFTAKDVSTGIKLFCNLGVRSPSLAATPHRKQRLLNLDSECLIFVQVSHVVHTDQAKFPSSDPIRSKMGITQL